MYIFVDNLQQTQKLVQIRPQVSVDDLTTAESRLPTSQAAQVDRQRADAPTRVRLDMLQPHECSLTSPLTGVDHLIVAYQDITESPPWRSVLFLGIFTHAANILSLVSRRIVLGSPAAARALRPPAAMTSGTCQMCGFSSPSVPPIHHCYLIALIASPAASACRPAMTNAYSETLAFGSPSFWATGLYAKISQHVVQIVVVHVLDKAENTRRAAGADNHLR